MYDELYRAVVWKNDVIHKPEVRNIATPPEEDQAMAICNVH